MNTRQFEAALRGEFMSRDLADALDLFPEPVVCQWNKHSGVFYYGQKLDPIAFYPAEGVCFYDGIPLVILVPSVHTGYRTRVEIVEDSATGESTPVRRKELTEYMNWSEHWLYNAANATAWRNDAIDNYLDQKKKERDAAYWRRARGED